MRYFCKVADPSNTLTFGASTLSSSPSASESNCLISFGAAALLRCCSLTLIYFPNKAVVLFYAMTLSSTSFFVCLWRVKKARMLPNCPLLFFFSLVGEFCIETGAVFVTY